MKLSKLATLLTCTSLLAFSLTAAPTNLRYIEFEDSETLVHVNQDENEMTQVSVQLNNEKHEFTLTPEELKDVNVIESRLAPLPEESRIKLAKLLSRMNKGGEHKFHIIQAPELEPKLEKKLQALAIKMEGKEAEMHEIAIKLKAKAAELDPKLEKKLQAMAIKMEGKEAEMEKMAIMLEAKAAEIEAHALEFEALQEFHEEEFDVVIEALEQHVSEIVAEIDDIDIDFDEIGSDGSHYIIIRNDNEDKHVEHLIKAIKASELTDKEKQAIKEALN
ncbi:conserved hypothetical protein [Shewanella sediminis HAW-EB3]|uniref:Uncharacterized protein n=1 Tax=Shewanella sediminis (strain HAW-EB3) TaxID=425104 RepID=A8FU84_SHESH|nr:hypothetical protein [Shewanella sediminis]ABV36407.1 conserved hypothetical protein [Shewanella sediminis HAW-EB3]